VHFREGWTGEINLQYTFDLAMVMVYQRTYPLQINQYLHVIHISVCTRSLYIPENIH
jgi:hypothetical protein